VDSNGSDGCAAFVSAAVSRARNSTLSSIRPCSIGRAPWSSSARLPVPRRVPAAHTPEPSRRAGSRSHRTRCHRSLPRRSRRSHDVREGVDETVTPHRVADREARVRVIRRDHCEVSGEDRISKGARRRGSFDIARKHGDRRAAFVNSAAGRGAIRPPCSTGDNGCSGKRGVAAGTPRRGHPLRWRITP
jgi:hypothetical protein